MYIFSRALKDDQDVSSATGDIWQRMLVSFVEGRTLDTAITGKVVEESPFSPMQASAPWERVSGRCFI